LALLSAKQFSYQHCGTILGERASENLIEIKNILECPSWHTFKTLLHLPNIFRIFSYLRSSKSVCISKFHFRMMMISS